MYQFDKTMHHTNTICAAMRADYDTGTFVDGKSEKGYESFYWTLYKKNGSQISVKYDIASGSVEVGTIDKARKNGKGFHFYNPEKSKKIRRLVLALAMRDIPVTFENYFSE